MTSVYDLIRSSKMLTQVGRYFYYKNRLKSNEDFEIIKYSGSMIILEHRASKKRIALSPNYAYITLVEWPSWKDAYLPKFDLKDKVVLDIGSGCGETAFFYLLHGASKVICVESNARAIEFQHYNRDTYNLNIEISERSFELGMLDTYKADFMKVDCDGCEKELLKLGTLSMPCIIETHDEDTKRALIQKFKLREIMDMDKQLGVSIIGSF